MFWQARIWGVLVKSKTDFISKNCCIKQALNFTVYRYNVLQVQYNEYMTVSQRMCKGCSSFRNGFSRVKIAVRELVLLDEDQITHVSSSKN